MSCMFLFNKSTVFQAVSISDAKVPSLLDKGYTMHNFLLIIDKELEMK